jgi:chromate transporter
VLAFAGGAGVATSAAAPAPLGKLFLVFLKLGSVVFGSGYVLLAFLRADLVAGTHWLTESQLLDAVAVGQVTPGPVFTAATFIGYVVAGLPGAAVATLGIFLPSFLLVAASGPLIPRLRSSPAAAAFLDGVNAAAVGVIAVVGVELARTALVDVPTILVAALGFVALVFFRLNSAWLVLAGALVGLILS